MANTHETLGSLFTDIANSIRGKTGNSASIIADNFPEAIDEISTGFPNGTDWKETNVTAVIHDLYYASGIYVAGTSSGIRYSTDGINWNYTNIVTGTISAFDYANGKWVAVGQPSSYYSTDGINWTQITSISTSLSGICYADGFWVAWYSTTAYKSSDGISWEALPQLPESILYFANGVWKSGRYHSTDSMTTWVEDTNLTVSAENFYFANGIWICYRQPNKGLYYSIDGMNWKTTNINSGTFGAVFYADGLWVASSSTNMYYSIDGLTWVDSEYSFNNVVKITYANGIWLAGTEDNFANSIIYSTDGKVWTRATGISGKVSRILNAKGIWIAAGSAGNGIYYSPTWLPSTN